jgi:hypothetical protein
VRQRVGGCLGRHWRRHARHVGTGHRQSSWPARPKPRCSRVPPQWSCRGRYRIVDAVRPIAARGELAHRGQEAGNERGPTRQDRQPQPPNVIARTENRRSGLCRCPETSQKCPRQDSNLRPRLRRPVTQLRRRPLSTTPDSAQGSLSSVAAV